MSNKEEKLVVMMRAAYLRSLSPTKKEGKWREADSSHFNENPYSVSPTKEVLRSLRVPNHQKNVIVILVHCCIALKAVEKGDHNNNKKLTDHDQMASGTW